LDWKSYIGIKKASGGKGYFVSTAEINEEAIRRYVESKEKEKTRQVKCEF